jgi:hypothetical protein
LHDVTEIARAAAFLDALARVGVHQEGVLVAITVSAGVDPYLPDDAWELLPYLELVGGLAHVECMPVENFLAVDEGLVDEHFQDSFPLKVARITDRHEMPVVPGLIEPVVDVFDCVVKVHS